MKILLIRGGAVGDFVLTLPLLEEIRRRYESADVVILGYPEIAALAVERRHATSARRVDGAEWAPLFARGGELRDTERNWLADFAVVLCIWPDGDGVIRENLIRAGVREPVCLEPMPPEGTDIHAVDYLAKQSAKAGFEIKHLEPHLYPSMHDRWWVERYMRVTCAGEQPLLGIAPGSGSARKNWPAERFAAVAREWMRRRGHVLLIGGPADEAAIAQFQEAAGNKGIFPLLGEELPRVAAALERCEAFIGNDSGISHMAAAVRTPTVVVFGETDPRQWRPLAPKVEVIRAPDGNLAGVTPEAAFSALQRVLGRA